MRGGLGAFARDLDDPNSEEILTAFVLAGSGGSTRIVLTRYSALEASVDLRPFVSTLTLALVVSGVARAGEGSEGEPVRVEYTAPAGCPDQSAFEVELTQHLGTETFARFGELARTLAVAIEPAPDGFRADVTLIDRRGLRVERGISAPTCDQAMHAIALITALAARSQVERTDRAKEEEAPGVAADPAEPAPLQPQVAREEPSARKPPFPERAPAVTPRARSVTYGLSAGMGAATGVGPRVAPGLLVLFRAALAGNPEHSVVLSAMGYDTFRSSLEVADVRFRVLKARLEVCPAEPRFGGRWLASACAGFELGSQAARSYPDGIRVETPRSATRLWTAATFAARLGLSVNALRFVLGPELGVPLERNGYALTRPDRPVYRVPSVTLGFSAAAGLTWR
jgi:hypothetical protein